MRINGRLLLHYAVAILGILGAADGFSQTTNFGDRTPASEEFIQALVPDSEPSGAKSIEPTQPHAPKAVSMAIRFAFGSNQVSAESHEALNNLGNALLSNSLKGSHIGIVGHTDAVGSREFNQVLSEKRALAVKNYLVSNFHIDEKRFETMGKGKDQLLDKEKPNSAVNRRVEIINRGS